MKNSVIWLFVSLFALMLLAACETDNSADPDAGADGQPCRAGNQCDAGLVCTEGICGESDGDGDRDADPDPENQAGHDMDSDMDLDTDSSDSEPVMENGDEDAESADSEPAMEEGEGDSDHIFTAESDRDRDEAVSCREEGRLDCDGQELLVRCTDGQWVAEENCAAENRQCLFDACIDPAEVICQNGQLRCGAATVIQKCNKYGTGWNHLRDCQANEACQEGECKSINGRHLCIDDSNCPEQHYCFHGLAESFSGYCRPYCDLADQHCPVGFQCSERICIKRNNYCYNDEQCAADEYCNTDNDTCTPKCTNPGVSCPECSYCTEDPESWRYGQCYPYGVCTHCESDDDCTETQWCYISPKFTRGNCHEKCAGDDDCLAPKLCTDGKCLIQQSESCGACRQYDPVAGQCKYVCNYGEICNEEGNECEKTDCDNDGFCSGGMIDGCCPGYACVIWAYSKNAGYCAPVCKSDYDCHSDEHCASGCTDGENPCGPCRKFDEELQSCVWQCVAGYTCGDNFTCVKDEVCTDPGICGPGLKNCCPGYECVIPAAETTGSCQPAR